MTAPGPLGLALPIVQAPMAGVSCPALAAAVAEAGGLGSIALGAGDALAAAAQIRDLRARTNRPFNVNLFVHAPPAPDPAKEAAWIERWRGRFAEFGATPPERLAPLYTSFAQDDAMLALLLAERPAVVSLHFGLPDAARIAALKAAGITLLATVTNPAEARAAVTAGIDVLVAQGWEAGGHRGQFDPEAEDPRLGTLALVRLLARLPVPVIAAGGIMDGAGASAVLALGAAAVQLGTAYIACPESLAAPGWKRALTEPAAEATVMTRVISGRPARALRNAIAHAAVPDDAIPAYPVAYDLGKALATAARAAGNEEYGAWWAGQGAPLARTMAAAELTRTIAAEMKL